ncbi:MAG: cation:proton antiporter [Hyphomicrobiales bacterium]
MHNEEALHIREVMIFLAAAGVVVPLVRRLKVSPVLGFLLVGLAIGPYGLARFADVVPWLRYIVISDIEGVRPLAELGVVFLLFMIGLELSVARLWAMRRLVFGLGGAQVVVGGIVIAGIASLFDNALPAAIVLGCAFALSSTAIVMQLLAENRRLGTATGRTTFAILLFQDLAVLPVLFLVGALGASDDGSVALTFVLAIGQAAAAVAVILVLGRLLLRPLFRFLGKDVSRESFLAFVVLVVIGTALATAHFGLSMALGAFLAGLLLSETEYRHEIEIDVEPFKGLLLGLFFASVGMAVDLSVVMDKAFWLLASLFGLFLVKAPIIYVLARLFGELRATALESGLLLGQGGEFALIIVGMAATLRIIPPETAQFMLIVTGITMLATSLVAAGARKLAARVEAREAGKGQSTAAASELSGHVIIAGYGRVGRTIGAILESQQIPHIGIDAEARLVSGYRGQGASVYFGDASRPELLRKFSIESAMALVVTINNPRNAERIVTTVRNHWPELPVYARSHDAEHAADLAALGAKEVVLETFEASLQLGELVLKGAGMPEQASRAIVESLRLPGRQETALGAAPE